MIATDEQLERVFDLIKQFAEMRHHSMTDVTVALLKSRTLARYGYNGSGRLNEEQADVAIGILESWIEKAKAL